ncbi:hypothetical protein Vi05172_g8853 [Venturia inaequalis]|nr:hypothetical protein Vi05172_g8853 [Venturia inaequalis]
MRNQLASDRVEEDVLLGIRAWKSWHNHECDTTPYKMPAPRPSALRRSSTISTATSRIQFQSYFCRGTTNSPCTRCAKGWITGAEEIARHIRQWHECTNLTMETFYECPCTCHGAAFSTMGDLLLHISQKHPQRLSRHERTGQSPAPDDLEGDVGEVELESEDEGLIMMTSRQSSSDKLSLKSRGSP